VCIDKPSKFDGVEGIPDVQSSRTFPVDLLQIGCPAGSLDIFAEGNPNANKPILRDIGIVTNLDPLKLFGLLSQSEEGLQLI